MLLRECYGYVNNKNSLSLSGGPKKNSRVIFDWFEETNRSYFKL